MVRFRKRWKYIQKRSCQKNWINKLGPRKYEKSDTKILNVIESKINEILGRINQTDELRITLFNSVFIYSQLVLLNIE